MVSNIRVSNGIMNVIMNYYRNIDRNLIQFDFVYFDEFDTNTFKNEITALGGRIYKINRPRLSWKYEKEVFSFFEQQKGEHQILHIHEVFLAPLFVPVVKRNGISSIVIHAHSSAFGSNKKSSFRNRILCYFANKICNYRAACSEEAANKYYGKKIFLNNQYLLIHNAIDVERYGYKIENRKRYRSLFQLEDDDIVIGTVGRLEREKNHQFLLDILEKLLKQNLHYKLLLVGEGSLEETLREKSIQLGIEHRVIFAGKRTDVNHIYSCMDIFVQPSIYEGLSLASVEAQAAGLPCVFSDTITKEADLVQTTYVSLDDNAERWADIIMNIDLGQNRDTVDLVRKKGYDIKQEALKLMDFYRSISIHDLEET